MKKAKRILANYDARISKIDIKPKNKHTKVILSSQMYHEEMDQKEAVKLIFVDVAAIDFRMNYFESMMGIEAMGLYEVTDKTFIERLVKEIFERRKEIYLLEGDYNYDEDDEADMLNSFDEIHIFFRRERQLSYLCTECRCRCIYYCGERFED